ncbi:MAG: DUF4421 family protein [Prevotella sp.]|nr:DUF4421 family protein [Prevotella sp.]
MKRRTILLCSLFCGMAVYASEPRKGLDKYWAVRAAKGLMAFIDTMTVMGKDPRYIEVPKRPWQVILRGNVNQSDLKLKSDIDGGSMFVNVVGDLHWEPRIKTAPATYVGIWAGYRGYGLGYSWNVGGDKGSILTFGAMGGSYGINLRVHRFENDEPEVHYTGYFLKEINAPVESATYFSYREKADLASPIKTHTLILDGYYLFNGKHFSYSAAYDQSVIQRRSAGSLMAGAMYYYSHINYTADENADFILMMDNIGHVKQWQASVGVGYAYNLVPCRGLLINAMAMPMLTFINRHKTWRYDSNYRDLALDNDLHNEDTLPMEDWKLKEEPLSVNDTQSNMTFTVDARLSVTYNWDRFFVNAYGQFSNFHYKDGGVKGRLHDWYVNACVGIRF